MDLQEDFSELRLLRVTGQRPRVANISTGIFDEASAGMSHSHPHE